jgi:hypothetical protein
MRRLLALTESNEHLTELLRRRHISRAVDAIGNEPATRFDNFTVRRNTVPAPGWRDRRDRSDPYALREGDRGRHACVEACLRLA